MTLDLDTIIRKKLEEIEKLMKEFIRLEEKKTQFEMNKIVDSGNGSGRVEKPTTSLVSSVTEEADKMKTPRSKYVQRNKAGRHASRPSQYQTSPSHPLRVYSLRSKHAQEKSEQTPKFTPPLEVEVISFHFFYRITLDICLA